jgi:hypothetical protein
MAAVKATVSAARATAYHLSLPSGKTEGDLFSDVSISGSTPGEGAGVGGRSVEVEVVVGGR